MAWKVSNQHGATWDAISPAARPSLQVGTAQLRSERTHDAKLLAEDIGPLDRCDVGKDKERGELLSTQGSDLRSKTALIMRLKVDPVF